MKMGLGDFFAGASVRVGLLNSAMAHVGPAAEEAQAALSKLDPKTREAIERRIKYAQLWRQATAMLMTGPKATPPRSSTVRRMIRLLANKGPSVQGARIERNGKWVHPTKRRAAWA